MMFRPARYALAVAAFATLPVLVTIWLNDIGGVSPEGNRLLRLSITITSFVLFGSAGVAFCLPDAAPDFLRHLWGENPIWDCDGFTFVIFLEADEERFTRFEIVGQNPFDSSVSVEIVLTAVHRSARGIFQKVRLNCPAGGVVRHTERLGIAAHRQGEAQDFFIVASAQWEKVLARELRRRRGERVPSPVESSVPKWLSILQLLAFHSVPASPTARIRFDFPEGVSEVPPRLRRTEDVVLWTPGDPLPKNYREMLSGKCHRANDVLRKAIQ